MKKLNKSKKLKKSKKEKIDISPFLTEEELRETDEGTTLTLRNKYTEITIKNPSSDLSIDEMFEDLLIPLLHAMTYQPGSIEGWIRDD